MRFAIEFSSDAERDFDLIFDHLFESHVSFGDSTAETLDHAARRVMDICKAADRTARKVRILARAAHRRKGAR
jgi:plasmid stabilization system protein ParE